MAPPLSSPGGPWDGDWDTWRRGAKWRACSCTLLLVTDKRSARTTTWLVGDELRGGAPWTGAQKACLCRGGAGKSWRAREESIERGQESKSD